MVAYHTALHQLGLVDMELTPSSGVSIVARVAKSLVGSAAMVLDDEIIGLRSRLDRLQRSLLFIDEPVATALIKGVIADMEARIAAVESDRQQQASEGVKTP